MSHTSVLRPASTHSLARSATWVLVGLLAGCQPAPGPAPAPEPEPKPAAEATPISGMAPVNDIEMHYEIHGAGTPLILLHGGLGNTGHWRNQVPVLSRHYRVICLDSRGHGRSTFSDQRIGYALMASDVLAMMDHLGIERAHVLGWSDGGNIGLHLAIDQPERLDKLIISGANYSPSGIRPDVGENPKFQAYFEETAKEYQALSPEPGRWDELLQNISQMWTSEPNFTAEQLASIEVPMLLLDGDSDEGIYTEHTREMADLIPTARLELMADTGHFALWEQPQVVNQAILEFLAE